MLVALGGLLQGRIAGCAPRSSTLGTSRRATAGFWCIHWSVQHNQKLRKPPTHPVGRQLALFQGTLPWQSLVGDAGTSQAELRIGREDQPTPAISLVRVADPRHRPVQGLLEEADGMLHIKPVDVGPPESGQFRTIRPMVEQPERLRLAGPAWKSAHLDQDYGASDDGARAKGSFGDSVWSGTLLALVGSEKGSRSRIFDFLLLPHLGRVGSLEPTLPALFMRLYGPRPITMSAAE